MRNWGIAFIVFGSLSIIGLISEPNEDTLRGVVTSALFIGGGFYMTKRGQKYIDLMKKISDVSFNEIRNKNYIDALSLSEQFEMSEVEIRQIIEKCQEKNFLPYGIKIK